MKKSSILLFAHCSLKNSLFQRAKVLRQDIGVNRRCQIQSDSYLRSTALPSQANTGQYQPKKYVHCQQSCCHNSRHPIWQTRRLAIVPLTLFTLCWHSGSLPRTNTHSSLYQAVCQARMASNILIVLTS